MGVSATRTGTVTSHVRRIVSLVPRRCVDFPLPDESHFHTVWTGTASCGHKWGTKYLCYILGPPQLATGGCNDGSLGRSKNAAHILCSPLCSPLMTTRGGTGPDGVEMTLIRERKSTHRLGTRLTKDACTCSSGYTQT